MLSKIKQYIMSSLLVCLLVFLFAVSSAGVAQSAVQSSVAQSEEIGAEITDAQAILMLDLPSMSMGTQIQVVSPDLTTNYGLASVVDGELILDNALEPFTEVRLLISHAGTGEIAMPTAIVSESGSDFVLHIPNAESVVQYISFRSWLSAERGLRMIFPAASASN